MIKNLVFDVGGVLLQYRWLDMFMSYGLTREEAVELGDKVMNSEPWTRGLDGGYLTVKQAEDEISKLFPEDEFYIRNFLEQFEQMAVPRPEVWEKINRLKEKGYRIYLLSNYSGELLEKHLKNATFLKSLDGYVISCQLHIMKPASEIYNALLNKYDLIAEECLFFDDRLVNIQGCEKVSMQGFHVTSRDALNKKLDELLL